MENRTQLEAESIKGAEELTVHNKVMKGENQIFIHI